MKTTGTLSLLAALVVATLILSGTAEARGVRTYAGGRGYNYRQPSVDTRLSQWNESRLIRRGRRGNTAGVPLAFGDSAVEFFQFKFSGKIVIVPRRNAIESVQRALKGLGYYRGPVSGATNREFEQALRKYQAESGARNTGVVDAETVHTLGLNATSFSR